MRVSGWAIAVAVSLGALLEIIDTSIVNVALSDMQASLGATVAQASSKPARRQTEITFSFIYLYLFPVTSCPARMRGSARRGHILG